MPEPPNAEDEQTGFSKRSAGIAALAAFWLLGIGFGFWHASTYQNQPGAIASSPVRWPQLSRISPAPSKPTLVMFVHPKCPCSRASIAELAKVQARVGERLASYVMFIRPANCAPGWEKTDLWNSASDIPGVQCRLDEGGVESKRFGAATSGMTFVFDSQGKLAYRGGVTASRGHQGGNDGADSIIAVACGTEAPCEQASVFGCPLFAPRVNENSLAGATR